MANIQVRQATLDDTSAISALFRSQIGVWQRLNAQGQVENVAYEALSIYDRWQHGGAWMSIETGAIHLCRLLLGTGLALVATDGGQVVGYAEAYHSIEPAPFGNHVHLTHLIADGERGDQTETALIHGLLAHVRTLKAQYLMTTKATETDALFAQHFVAKPVARMQRFTVTAKTGQIFYQATEHHQDDAAQIHNWMMPVGRFTSAAAQWENVWARTWNAIPEIEHQRTDRMRFTAAGQEALVCLRQQQYDPRSAEVYCWSPKTLSNQLLSAIRDWAHREGYRTLIMLVPDDVVKTLGAEGELDGFIQTTLTIAAE